MFDRNVYVIGCGGIGGYVINLLPQTMACVAVDLAVKTFIEQTPQYTDEIRNRIISDFIGTEGIFDGYGDDYGILNNFNNVFGSLTLIDGDTFSGHNALRQAGISGSKLELQLAQIRQQDAFTTWLHSCRLQGFNTYIKPSNMRKIFIGLDGGDSCKLYTNGNKKIIFLCVDNHKTRYEVTRFVETHLPNAIIINGGNDKTTGNVTVFERRNGVNLDPPIYKVYPEVNDTADRRPDEVGCGTVALSNDQTAITNNMIASIMLSLFREYIVNDTLEYKTRKKDANGNHIKARRNEVIIDFNTYSMVTLPRAKDLDNRIKVSETEGVKLDEVDEKHLM